MNTWFHGLANVTLAERLIGGPGGRSESPESSALGRRGGLRRWSWLRLRTVFWASLIPDVPLILLTFWYFAVYGLNFGPRYDELFYTEPLWIVAHNLFHAPFVILAIALPGLVLLKTRSELTVGAQLPFRRNPAAHLLSFAFGAGLHSLVDIPTHHADGPLLLFPFDWTYRFSSPISYWDPGHFGLIVLPFETVAMVLMIIYWRRKRKKSRDRRPAVAAGS